MIKMKVRDTLINGKRMNLIMIIIQFKFKDWISDTLHVRRVEEVSFEKVVIVTRYEELDPNVQEGYQK